MDLGLAGRRIAITGASAGIGGAVALALAKDGAKLIIAARRRADVERTAEEVRALGAEVAVSVGDLTVPDAIAAFATAAETFLGGLDGLVCCVGSTPLGSFLTLDDDAWERAFNMKFLATVRVVRALLPIMSHSDGARVVVIAGNSSFDPDPLMVTSATINAALGALVSALARQFAADGVGFVCVDPGPTDTSRYAGLIRTVAQARAIDDVAADQLLRDRIPTGRITSPEEVAAAVAVLVSPRIRQLTGTRVVIDGASTWVR